MIVPRSVTLEFADKAFFSIPPKKLKVEEEPNTGRTYFINDGRIVAVAKPEHRQDRR